MTSSMAACDNDHATLVAGTWTETKKMYHGGFFLNWQMIFKLADDVV